MNESLSGCCPCLRTKGKEGKSGYKETSEDKHHLIHSLDSIDKRREEVAFGPALVSFKIRV